MKVVVEMLTGPLFNIEVGDDATIADLKKEIAAKQEMPSDRLILTLDSSGNDQVHTIIHDDQDGDSLVDCGIKDGSKIFIFFTPIDDGSTRQFVESALLDSSMD